MIELQGNVTQKKHYVGGNKKRATLTLLCFTYLPAIPPPSCGCTYYYAHSQNNDCKGKAAPKQRGYYKSVLIVTLFVFFFYAMWNRKS